MDFTRNRLGYYAPLQICSRMNINIKRGFTMIFYAKSKHQPPLQNNLKIKYKSCIYMKKPTYIGAVLSLCVKE